MPPKILIVEDDFIASDEIRDRLRILGYPDCETAFNGQEAIAKAAQFLPDLVLMDINLGDGIDGIEAAAQIRETRNIPIIYLTAYDDDATLKRATITVPYAYILKPFEGRELHVALEIALYKHDVEARLAQALRDSQQREWKITELSERLQAQNAELQELNTTKDMFFSIIAHDLKNPFFSVLAGTKLIEEGLQKDCGENLSEFAHALHNSAQQLYELLENLLSWARVQQGTIPYTPVSIELTTAIKYSISLVQENAALKHIALTNAIEEKFVVQADADMLNTILMNLIANAVKFTPQGGTVRITAQAHDGMVEISVADTGVGMSEAKLQRLFNIGEKRISTLGTNGERGTGLGLIVCRAFVERHGGRIWAESEEGRGSVLRFTLPAT